MEILKSNFPNGMGQICLCVYLDCYTGEGGGKQEWWERQSRQVRERQTMKKESPHNSKMRYSNFIHISSNMKHHTSWGKLPLRNSLPSTFELCPYRAISEAYVCKLNCLVVSTLQPIWHWVAVLTLCLQFVMTYVCFVFFYVQEDNFI